MAGDSVACPLEESAEAGDRRMASCPWAGEASAEEDPFPGEACRAGKGDSDVGDQDEAPGAQGDHVGQITSRADTDLLVKKKTQGRTVRYAGTEPHRKHKACLPGWPAVPGCKYRQLFPHVHVPGKGKRSGQSEVSRGHVYIDCAWKSKC